MDFVLPKSCINIYITILANPGLNKILDMKFKLLQMLHPRLPFHESGFRVLNFVQSCSVSIISIQNYAVKVRVVTVNFLLKCTFSQ